jgi:hypothetical protein
MKELVPIASAVVTLSINLLLIATLATTHKPQEAPSSPSLAKAPPIPTQGLPAADVRLIQTLNSRGIPVVATAGCMPSVLGSYEFRQNVVVICTNARDPDLSDTLRHEAIHAAQDCKAGLRNSQLSVLSPSINPFLNGAPLDQLGRALREAYSNPDHHAIEWEAWTKAAALTSDQVASLVTRYCASN